MPMLTIVEPEELVKFEGCTFVPTMGALHDGHLSLIKEAKRLGREVLVSIFVNPEQFAPDEDFEKYPRNIERDSNFAKNAGADVIFAPEVGTIYPNSPPNISLPHAATEPKLEDAFRPAHFRGVCLVVARLFDLVKPSSAIFGEKDYQQLLVIQQMVNGDRARWSDLEIIGAPIIRDDDGLALSSRNEYLSTDDRCQALAIHKALREPTEQKMFDLLDNHGLEIEYAVLRDEATLLQPQNGKPMRALIAARVGDVRLIDNCSVETKQ
jgi:pantoate--beta-alanine ligase